MAKDSMNKDPQVSSSPALQSLRLASHRHNSPPTSPARVDASPRQGAGGSSSSGSGTSHWHKTSFKLSKVKASKARYLTKSEMVGISISICLSFLFAVVIAFTIYISTPIVTKQASNLLEDLWYISAIARGKGGSGGLSESKSSLDVAVSDLSTEEFLSVYYNKIPAVFQAHDKRTLMDLIQSSILSPENLRKELPLRPLDWYANQSSPAIRNLTVAELLRETDDLESATSSPYSSPSQDCYFVDDDFVEASEVLREQVCGATDFLDPEKNIFFRNIAQSIKLSVGRNVSMYSGSPFHAHVQTLNYLLIGKKQWAVFPPKGLPATGFNPLRNLHYWQTMPPSSSDAFTSMTTSASTSTEQPIILTQSAGQWVYIPDGWLHATDTLSNVSVAISFRASIPARSSYLHFLQQGDKKMLGGDFDGAIKLYKLGLGLSRNGFLLRRLGEALKAQRSLAAAEETYREAIRINPLDVLSFAKLLGLLVANEGRDVSNDIADLLAQAEQRGLRDQVLALTDDSLT